MAEKDETKSEEKPASSKAGGKEEKPAPKDNLVVTNHAVRIGGKEIKYTVTAGTMILRQEAADREKEAEGEKPRAQIFFIAYTRDGIGSKARRPLTISFNGGPGSSSVWLHLGVLGPRRVVLQEDGNLPKPPYQLTDNEYSLLDQTDLVFIDPMNTARGKKKAVIVFDDMTRPTPVKEVAPFMRESLHQAGMGKDRIRFIWGLGAHGAYDMINARKKLGDEIVQ